MDLRQEIRVFSQFNNLPVYMVNSTFGGATGNGGNHSQSGTPGGGSGGAIYNDGNTMTLTILGTRIEKNKVNAFGSAIFFVTNDHSGDIRIDSSTIQYNVGGSWYPVFPQISMHSDTKCVVTNSIIE
jgi:hypothetical protein